MNVLIVDDAPSALDLLFKSDGAKTTVASEDAEDYLSVYAYDLIVLNDATAAGLIGLIRSIRDRKIVTPIIVVSPDDSVERKVRLLNAGADDYLVAPYHRDELLARSRVAVRRSQGRPTNVVTAGPITVDMGNGTVRVNDERVHLTPTETAILLTLAGMKGKTVSKDAIMNAVYAHEADEPDIKIIDVLVCKMRAKLAPLGGADEHIVTDWGRGYRLDDETQPGRRVKGIDAQAAVLQALAATSRQPIRDIARAVRRPAYVVSGALNTLLREGHVDFSLLRNTRDRTRFWSITDAGRAQLPQTESKAA